MLNIEDKMESLRSEIINHDKLYSEGNPIITDAEYDKLYIELLSLEEKYPEFASELSPTQKIITTTVDELQKVRHIKPMLSQEKISDKEGIVNFVSKDPSNILLQEKLDGISIILRYRDGKLVKAITRGDGEVGEDLYHNVLQIDNVPKKIGYGGDLEIRGEAIIPFDKFNEINVDGNYSNPRNLVSGLLRQLDSKMVTDKGIKVIVFDVVDIKGKSFQKDMDRLDFLSQLGFEVVKTSLFRPTDLNGISEYINNYENKTRQDLDYMIDGMVLKYNDLVLREVLGSTSKHPRWSVAYKFASANTNTKLINVTEQVGKSGQITPVAELEPVIIDGVKINRASLHNYGDTNLKDIRIGDTVVIERANDVIPQVIEPVLSHRDGSELKIHYPKVCPVCESPTRLDGAILRCIGLNCKPQIEGRLKHFASREAMDIDGLGEKTIEVFSNNNIITSLVDVYRISDHRDEIMALEGFGEKSFERIVNGIEKSKQKHLHNFVYGLAINNIGRSASKDFVDKFKTMDKILESSKDLHNFKKEIFSIHGFGEVMSESLATFFSSQENIDTIETLLELGLPNEAEESNKGSSLKDIVFVITGETVEFKNRSELTSHINNLGGNVTGSVSGNTDYLISNDKESTSSKNKRAKELNVPIITELELLEMIP